MKTLKNSALSINHFFALTIIGLIFSLPASAQRYDDNYANDRAQIIDLQGRYVLAMDFQDAEAYAAVFTENAELDWARGVIEGREAIYQFMAQGVYNPSKDSLDEVWPAASRHFITNQVISVYGDTAKAVTYWLQANNNAERSIMTWALYGHYEDELEKVNGEWLFSRRAIYNEGLNGRHRAGTANPTPE